MNYYIVFSSITHATRLKKSFSGSRYNLTLLHTPRAIPVTSCSYSLNVSFDTCRPVLERAAELGIRVKAVYLRNQNGEYTEVHDLP